MTPKHIRRSATPETVGVERRTDDPDEAHLGGQLSKAGVGGVIIVWADPVDGLERFADAVLPQLERHGLRV